MIVRIYHITQGRHVHCRMFVGHQEGNLGKAGDLVFDVDEFIIFREMNPVFDFRPDKATETRFHSEPSA